MGWQRTGALRVACNLVSPRVDFAEADEALLAKKVYRHLLRHPGSSTVPELADLHDCSPARIRAALVAINDSGHHLTSPGDDLVSLDNLAPNACHTHRPGWGEKRLLFGYVSDTHIGNLCAATDELEWLYDLFAEEGCQSVLHSGDLVDGPGNMGFSGHAHEVDQNCQTAHQQVRFVVDHYPRRDGLKTYFIESGKSHAGWELSRTGYSIGHSIAEGYIRNEIGPNGFDRVREPGRDDMVFLGYDDAEIRVGPEENTRIRLHHPDGGTAYALSYKPQKWAENLEGGTKPHLGLLGHYHKHSWISPRNMQVMTGGCVCWQTPFMSRKGIAAHVCGYIIEMAVDADGSIREFTPRQFPFYRPGSRYVGIGEAAA